MNKRANRVYWLLLIMILIMGVCILADEKRGQEEISSDTEITTSAPTEDRQTESTEMTSEGSTEQISEGSTEQVSEGDTESTTAADINVLTSYYKNTVFTGDSIMTGFATYISGRKTAPAWLKQCTYLAKTSWGIADALKGTNGPMYGGKAQGITASLAEIKPERIFINLGINEMNGLGSPGYSIEKLNGKYGELIADIKGAVPNAKLYILSVTPCTAAKQTSMFNNATIKKFNQSVADKAQEWGVTYLDFAAEFGEALAPEYANDGIHHTEKAFTEVWIPYFEKLAVENR